MHKNIDSSRRGPKKTTKPRLRHLDATPDHDARHDERHLAMQGSCTSDCTLHAFVMCILQKNLPCRFFCPARSLRAEISPSARRGSSVRFSPLVARARPLCGPRPLRGFFYKPCSGARETGARSVQNGGGKGNQTYVGQIMCVARFRAQRIFQFCQLQTTFLC